MKIYISGKISGLPIHIAEFGFKWAQNWLESKIQFDCKEAVNPMELLHDHDKSWKSYMREDLSALKSCTHIYMLFNWKESKGAIIEHWFAKRYNIEVIYQ